MRFFSKKTTKIACDLVFTGSMIVAANTCEGAMTGAFMTTAEALQLTMQSEARVYQVLISCGHGVYVSAILTQNGLCKPLFDALSARFIENAFVTLCGKPVRPDTPVSALNVQEGSCFVATRRMCGGSSAVRIKLHENYFSAPMNTPVTASGLQKIANAAGVPWVKTFGERAKEFEYTKGYYQERPKYEGVGPFNGEWMTFSCKGEMRKSVLGISQRLNKRCRRQMNAFELQSTPELDLRSRLMEHVDVDILSLVEDLGLLCVQLLRAKANADRALAVAVFIKLRTGSPLLLDAASIVSNVISDICDFDLQADDEIDSYLDKVTSFRDMLANWESLQESKLVKRIMNVFKYAVALGVFAAVGIKIDSKVASECKKEMLSPLAGPNFMVALLDLIALITQRALLFAKTGQWSAFFHGPTSYGKWYDSCMVLKRLHLNIGDLEAHGTSYHEFVKDLTQAIETGQAILKFGGQTGGEILAVKRLLNDMLLIQADMFTYSEAQKSRRPPFSLLVFGKTCVGKSTFTEMLFQYMGRVMKLPTDEAFKYSRNPCDDFWSGWNSSKWFVHLDDVAFLNPDAKQVDNSLMEIIQLVNDVPLVPNQARLEDKGKNPVRARAVVATTNTKHLNATANFACPVAVQRRFPFVLTVEPKAQYALDHDEHMIDSAKLPPIVDDWPDFWDITVERVVACGNNCAKYEVVKKFCDIHRFLEWLDDTIMNFQQIQARAGAGVKAMSQFKFCEMCRQIGSQCVCADVATYNEIQAGEYILPPEFPLGSVFTKTHSEGDNLWTYLYQPAPGNSEFNYTITTRKYTEGSLVEKFTRPIKVSVKDLPNTQTYEIEMAELIAEIVTRQTAASGSFTERIAGHCFRTYLSWYARSRTVRRLTTVASEWIIVRKLMMYALRWQSGGGRSFYELCGETARACYVSKRWKYVLAGLGAAAAMVTAYGLYSSYTKKHALEEQGLRVSVPDEHFPKSQKENVWKRDDYETSSFDKTTLNVSYTALTYDQVNDIVSRNTARIVASNGERAREGNAFCVGGHLWVTNNHTLFENSDLDVTLSTEIVQGAGPNVTMKLRQKDIFRVVDRDLAFFEVFCWETRRDLRELIRKKSLQGQYTGALIGYDKQRCKVVNVVKAIHFGSVTVEGLSPQLEAWHGHSRVLTQKGDCGMPLVVHSPVTAIIGLHTLGNNNQEIWATSIDQDVVNDAIGHFKTPIIQCGVPVIDAPSKPKKLVPLRQWSPLRWLEKGTLRVYGSYDGFSVTSRSKVRPTLLGQSILKERNWEQKFGKPDLRDWRPWRHALLDITNQQYGAVSPSEIRICADAFADDIIAGLTEEDKALFQPISDNAAINGITGVKFIDKMNFKSSMGEPYNASKKFYLEGEEGHKEFNEELKARIRRITKCYEEGRRACPVFSGKLKDEARAWKKLLDGKIRVFTGAPADWSFVVRKFSLGFVKLMQQNPFLFEASPGCTVQSAEWEQYYEFLTFFGFDQMVAGDYGKYDKKMEAIMILMAFYVIKRIAVACNWTEEEAAIFDVIGEDVAYSFVNFDGDLIQFLGSNPSGQPLTVIINCIVNCLYMRYAFMKTCPWKDDDYTNVRKFKQFVHLLTYGDDNTLGISKSIPWFNHTSIQTVMAGIGVEYTMADKESESKPYIHIRDVAYLKRTWRWDEDIGAVVCPLEEESIRKMLTICTPSETVSPELHMASVIVSAVNEWFWYGKERFEAERAWLVDLATRNDLLIELQHLKCPNWSELVDRYWQASTGIATKRSLGCVEEHPRSVLPN